MEDKLKRNPKIRIKKIMLKLIKLTQIEILLGWLAHQICHTLTDLNEIDDQN